MDEQELKQILATKAPAYQRSLIEIPKDSFVLRYSSLTDYLDSVLGDSPKMLNRIDHLVMRYRLGATDEVKGEHYGTVLPRINRKGMIVGGNVIHFNVDDGSILNHDALVNHLYSWYAFDYYVDPNVFFGEHLLYGRQAVVVQEEKTALLGTLAYPDIEWLAVGVGNNLTDEMMKKLIGRQIVLYPESSTLMTSALIFGRNISVASSRWMTASPIATLTSI